MPGARRKHPPWCKGRKKPLARTMKRHPGLRECTTAWTLSRYWPRMRPLFFGVAATLGYSRVFVGAHYPGDVATGAALGMTLSELIRRATDRR
jgi:hypothetical protein